MMIAIRKNRLTFENIMGRKAFTVNMPSASYVKETDYFGLVSGRKADKFDVVNLIAEPSMMVDAPLIKEFPFAMECKYIQSADVGQHVVIIGEIVNMSADETFLMEKGELNMSDAGLMIYDQTDNAYRLIGEKAGKAFSAGAGFIRREQGK